MTVTHIIAILSIGISAIVAFIIAHLQRKQMRQIELYKRDPSVGLVPPENALTRFVKSKWDTLLAFGGPIYILVSEAIKTTPPSRFSIYVVAFAMTLLVLNIVLSLILRVQTRFHERFMSLAELEGRNAEMIKVIAQSLALPKDPNA